jgi:serpin B
MLSTAGLAVFRQRHEALRAPAASHTAIGNLAVSPVSIGLALSMLGAGASKSEGAAGSATFDEIRAALGHAKLGDEEAAHKAVQRVVEVLDGDGLFMANSLWVVANVKDAFVRKCELVFGAAVYKLAGKEPINAYVEQKTEGLIKELLKQDPTSNLLLNVVALKLSWFSEFDARRSVQGAVFHSFDGEKSCRMMHKSKSRLNVCKSGASTVVLLPYANGMHEDARQAEDEDLASDFFRFCAVFVLPEQTGAPALAQAVDEVFGNLEAFVARATADTQLVTFAVPAFKVETGTLSIRRDLEALGIRRAFKPGDAELERMADGLTWVDDVLHNVVIEVDEKGTVAAAATAVATTKGASPKVTHVQIDRPFGFGVFDLNSRETLFAASVVDPKAAGL